MIGQRVRVARGADETFQPATRGRIGFVNYFEYNCGCGQAYPGDPMVGVMFRDGTTEEFWKEELDCCPSGKRRCAQRNR
jgi:hypothetical protein